MWAWRLANKKKNIKTQTTNTTVPTQTTAKSWNVPQDKIKINKYKYKKYGNLTKERKANNRKNLDTSK